MQEHYAISHPHHAVGVYIINDSVVAYHQPAGLDIIKPQVDARWRVMRYSPKGADDIHDCVVMICQACGLDKQKQNICLPTNVLFLLAEKEQIVLCTQLNNLW